MSNCTNCNGEGIVGQGDQPWLKQGKLETCTACKGTGKVGEETAQTESAADVSSDTAEAVGDNSPKDEGSLDGSSAGEPIPPAQEEPAAPAGETVEPAQTEVAG